MVRKEALSIRHLHKPLYASITFYNPNDKDEIINNNTKNAFKMKDDLQTGIK
jgi:hypothetical protein